MKEIEKRPNFKEIVLLILSYTLLYVFYFNVQLYDFGSTLLSDGKNKDILQVYWNTWHLSFKLQHLSNPFSSNFQLYPNEISLWLHAYTPFFGLLNLVFNNPVFAINIGLYIVFVFGSCLSYILTGLFIKNKIYRFIASSFYMFNLYTINKIGVHYNLLLICLTPIIIYVLLRAIDFVGDKIVYNTKFIFVAVVLVISNLMFDYYAIFYAFSFIFIYIFYFKYIMIWLEKFNLKKTVLLLILLLIMHVIIRLLRISGISENSALWSASDIRSYIMPSSKIYPDWLRLNVNLPTEHSLFVGYGLILAFTIVLFFKNKDRLTSFLLFTIVIYVLVSSPILRIDQKNLFYFPNGIIHFIPFVNNIRIPSRFIEMIFLIIPIYMFRKIELNNSVIKKSIVLFFFVLISFEQKIFAMDYLRVNIIDKKQFLSSYIIKDRLKSGEVILNIPFGIRDGFEEFGEFDENIFIEQSIHNLKVGSGYYSRIPKYVWQYYRNNKFYNLLVSAQNDTIVIAPSAKFVSEFINDNNIKAVFINKNYLNTKETLKIFINDVFPTNVYNREEINGRILIVLK